MSEIRIYQSLAITFSLFSFCVHTSGAQQLSSTPVVTSLLGKSLYPLDLPESVHDIYIRNLEKAKMDYHNNPKNAENIIWLGRRTAYFGEYHKAIEIFSEGIKIFPDDARMYRHRGHRYISIRKFDLAIEDFEKAARLILNKKDEIEPDGLPNYKNIPTSTLQSNIWYHLGLAYYLSGNLEKAFRCYVECMRVSGNNDMLVATSHWFYMTLRRMKREKEAAALLLPISEKMDIIENDSYHQLLLFYKGENAEKDLLENGQDALQNTTLAYGVANWHCYNGNEERGSQLLKGILASDYWPAFGYIAAEADVVDNRCR